MIPPAAGQTVGMIRKGIVSSRRLAEPDFGGGAEVWRNNQSREGREAVGPEPSAGLRRRRSRRGAAMGEAARASILPRAFAPIWGYLLALLIGLIIVAIFPWISIGFL